MLALIFEKELVTALIYTTSLGNLTILAALWFMLLQWIASRDESSATLIISKGGMKTMT